MGHPMSGIMLDGNGLALVITAVITGIIALGGFVMQVITFIDNRKRGKARSAEIKEVKDLVNGKTEKVIEAAAQEGYEKGREHERLAPGTPSPRVAVVPSAAIATAIQPMKDG
jgi:hypothetical protein